MRRVNVFGDLAGRDVVERVERDTVPLDPVARDAREDRKQRNETAIPFDFNDGSGRCAVAGTHVRSGDRGGGNVNTVEHRRPIDSRNLVGTRSPGGKGVDSRGFPDFADQ